MLKKVNTAAPDTSTMTRKMTVVKAILRASRSIDLRRRRPDHAEEDQCGANRVDERKKSAESKRKKFSHEQHANLWYQRVGMPWSGTGREKQVDSYTRLHPTKVTLLQFLLKDHS